MSKQTAVEWLIDKIEKNIHHTIKIPNEYFEQAKAMEKEQISIAYQSDRIPCSDEDAEQYYNETYGGDK